MNQTKPCPFCSEQILVDAKKCKHCGEFLDPKLIRQNKKSGFKISVSTIASITLLISFFLPWLSTSLFSLSGYEIPDVANKVERISSFISENVFKSINSSYIYLIPLLALISLICSFYKHPSYIAAIVTGTISSSIVIQFFDIIAFNSLNVEIGFWLTVISSLSLILLALADISEIVSDAIIEQGNPLKKMSKSKNFFWRSFITIFIFICYIIIISIIDKVI